MRRGVRFQDNLPEPSPHDARLSRIVCKLNIGRYKHLLNTDIDAATRETVNRLLAEEHLSLKQLLAGSSAYFEPKGFVRPAAGTDGCGKAPGTNSILDQVLTLSRWRSSQQ